LKSNKCHIFSPANVPIVIKVKDEETGEFLLDDKGRYITKNIYPEIDIFDIKSFIYKFISNSVYKSKAYNEKFGNIANTAQNLLFYNSPDIYTEKFGASNIEITDKYLNVTKSSMLEEYMSYYRPSDELCSNLELTGYNVRKISKIKDVYTKDELLDAKIYSCKGKIAVENENEKICKSIVLYDSKTLDLEK